jgi:hypothetical protein
VEEDESDDDSPRRPFMESELQDGWEQLVERLQNVDQSREYPQAADDTVAVCPTTQDPELWMIRTRVKIGFTL